MKLSKINIHSPLIRNLDTTILQIMLVNHDSRTIAISRRLILLFTRWRRRELAGGRRCVLLALVLGETFSDGEDAVNDNCVDAFFYLALYGTK